MESPYDPIAPLREALAASPDNVPLRRHLADQLARLERFEEAEVEFRDLLGRTPEDDGVRLALAEANATESVALAINKGGHDAVNYFVALKYTEALSEFARSPNQKTVFLPLEATALLGSIGGIKELLRELGPAPEGGQPLGPSRQQTAPRRSSVPTSPPTMSPPSARRVTPRPDEEGR